MRDWYAWVRAAHVAELAAERRRLQERITRKRARRSDGVALLGYRMRKIEERLRALEAAQAGKEDPGKR